MSEQVRNGFTDVVAELDQLKAQVDTILQRAKRLGATSAEVSISREAGLALSVRKAELETLEFHRDGGFGISLYFGQAKGSASTTDTSSAAIDSALAAAAAIARHTSSDPCAGLVDPDLLARQIPDLDLYHPWLLSVDDALELARATEQAGLEQSGIENSEGASLNSFEAVRVYGNSLGFIEGYASSRHGLSCVLIAGQGDGMQRDYAFRSSRVPGTNWQPADIGLEAAQRTLSRLDARSLSTRSCPVVFAPEVATGLLGHLVSAISGGSLYRRSSFLLDSLGQQVFPEWFSLEEQPHLRQALASAAFDAEGVATRQKYLVEQGRIASYLLGSYSARKLGLTPTGNGGGSHNLIARANFASQQQLLNSMGTGFLVTELMGQGVNLVTGDYSRGASGFWVEQGQICYPVQEVTIAGNLNEMFRQMQGVSAEQDPRFGIRTGAIWLEQMKVAGH